MANKDRKEICKIISDMLDNPDDNGIYPTSTAFARLEHLINSARFQAVGFTHAYLCSELDARDDPRTLEVPRLIEAASRLNES